MLSAPPITVPKSSVTLLTAPDSPPPAIVAPVALFVTVLPLQPPITLELVKPFIGSVTFACTVRALLLIEPCTLRSPFTVCVALNVFESLSKAKELAAQPPRKLTFRFATCVLEATERGAVPVPTVEMSWPLVLTFPVTPPANVTAPSNFVVPFTSSSALGVAVPTPTFPPAFRYNWLKLLLVPNTKSFAEFVYNFARVALMPKIML